jgi:anti-anti-sigma factor
MEITTSKTQGRVSVTVLHITGTVDSSTFQDFTNAMQGAIEGGAGFLLLDLARTIYMSSAGIRSLNEIALLLRRKYPQDAKSKMSERIKLLAPQERVLDVLKLSGVDTIFEIYANLETAMASF